jgi:hypothetical protein
MPLRVTTAVHEDFRFPPSSNGTKQRATVTAAVQLTAASASNQIAMPKSSLAQAPVFLDHDGVSTPPLASKPAFHSADQVVAMSMTTLHPISSELMPQPGYPGFPGDFDMAAEKGFTHHPTTSPPKDSRFIEPARTWITGVDGLSTPPPLLAQMPFDATDHVVATSMATPHPISNELAPQPGPSGVASCFDMTADPPFSQYSFQHSTISPPRDSRVVQPARTWLIGVDVEEGYSWRGLPLPLIGVDKPLTPDQKAKHSNWPEKKQRRMRTIPPRVNLKKRNAALAKGKYRRNGRFGPGPTPK